jgi:hypothetical protein
MMFHYSNTSSKPRHEALLRCVAWGTADGRPQVDSLRPITGDPGG